jgi:putative hydroxymethylpyrimidine transport system substrate-binding protein
VSPGRRPRRGVAALAAALGASLALVLGLAVGGCDGSSPSSSTQVRAPTGASAATTALAHRTRVTLILDFVPNAVHAGIYHALAAGYYRALNIDLRILQPSSTTDTLKLLDAGKADFGIADGSDLANQVAAGGDTQAIMALVQRPLGGLIGLSRERLASPRQLEGRTVGITGVPSDTAVLDTEVSNAGGDPRRVHVVTVGFNGATALVAGRVAAFTGFWPSDGVGLQVSGHPTTIFKLDDHGGPAYPGLVVFSTRARLRSDPALARAFAAATTHGYQDTVRDPARSLNDLLALNPSLPRALTSASLNAFLPLFARGGVPFGTLVAQRVRELSAWMVAHRLIRKPVSPDRYGTNEFLPKVG